VVAVKVNGQHLTGVHVVLGAVFVRTECAEGEVSVVSSLRPLLNGGHEFLKGLSEDVLFFL